MTTSATQSISANSTDAAFSPRELAVYEGYAQNEAHNAVLTALEMASNRGVTRAAIARMLGVSPSQVTRWLSSPGNYEMKTLGYLLAAMGYVPSIVPVEIATISHGKNFAHEVTDSPLSAIKVTSQASTTAPQAPRLKLAL